MTKIYRTTLSELKKLLKETAKSKSSLRQRAKNAEDQQNDIMRKLDELVEKVRNSSDAKSFEYNLWQTYKFLKDEIGDLSYT